MIFGLPTDPIPVQISLYYITEPLNKKLAGLSQPEMSL